MKRYLAALAIAVAACKKVPPPDWQLRHGPVFTVIAPYEATETSTTRDTPDGKMDIKVYIYTNTQRDSLQVSVASMIGMHDPYQVIVNMRDHIAKTGKILKETEVSLGDVAAKDLQYLAELPPLGMMHIRSRIVFHDRKVYQVMAVRVPDAPELDADGDRFVDSFTLTDKKVVDPLANAGIGSDSPLTVHPSNTASPDADGWYSAHSAGGRFRVRFPAPFLDGDIDAGKDTGKPVDVVMNMLASNRESDHVKFVAFCVRSNGTPAIDRVRGFAASIKEAASTERTVGGYPAADLDGGNARMRVIGLPDRTCSLIVEPISKDTKVPVADAQKMFDSFAPDP